MVTLDLAFRFNRLDGTSIGDERFRVKGFSLAGLGLEGMQVSLLSGLGMKASMIWWKFVVQPEHALWFVYV